MPPSSILRLLRAMVLATVVALNLPHDAIAASAPLPEYDVKAAFLLNIAKYASWPSQAFADSGSPLVIGILGDDPFGAVLDRLVSGRVINDRLVTVRRAKRASDLRGAHVVFIAASESERMAAVCAALTDCGALCVGDTESSAAQTAVNFSVDSGRIVFSVNLAVARRSNVAISSKLLQLARSVSGKPVGERMRP